VISVSPGLRRPERIVLLVSPQVNLPVP
jgi:hypothetical protein